MKRAMFLLTLTISLPVFSQVKGSPFMDHQLFQQDIKRDSDNYKITALKFSRDGKILASGSANATFIVKSLDGALNKSRYTGHIINGGVQEIFFSQSNTQVGALSGWNYTLIPLQEGYKKQEVNLGSIEPHGGISGSIPQGFEKLRREDVKVSDDGLSFVVIDSYFNRQDRKRISVMRWAGMSGQILEEQKGVTKAKFQSGNTGIDDDNLSFIRGQQFSNINGSNGERNIFYSGYGLGGVNDFAMSPAGDRVLLLELKRDGYHWVLYDGKQVIHESGPLDDNTSSNDRPYQHHFSFAPNGAVFTLRGELRNASTGELLLSFKGEESTRSLSYNNDGSRIAYKEGSELVVYDLNLEQEISRTGIGNITSFTLNPSGDLLATGSNNGQVQLINLNEILSDSQNKQGTKVNDSDRGQDEKHGHNPESRGDVKKSEQRR